MIIAPAPDEPGETMVALDLQDRMPGWTRLKSGTSHDRYHVSLDNLTPVDLFYGCGQEILNQRAAIKLNTLDMQRNMHLYQKHAVGRALATVDQCSLQLLSLDFTRAGARNGSYRDKYETTDDRRKNRTDDILERFLITLL